MNEEINKPKEAQITFRNPLKLLPIKECFYARKVAEMVSAQTEQVSHSFFLSCNLKIVIDINYIQYQLNSTLNHSLTFSSFEIKERNLSISEFKYVQ